MTPRALRAAVLLGCLGGTATAPAQETPTALVGGTVHTAAGPDLDAATIVIEGGRIVAVGSDVAPPAGATVVDVSGRHVYPGFLAPDSILGLTEIGQVAMSNDYAETGPFNPNIRAEIAFNPDSELIPVARVDGVTSAHVVPRGGDVAGTSAVMRLDGWTWEDMTLRAPAGLHVNWPQMTIPDRWSDPQERERRIEQRDEALERLERAFDDARAYWRAREAEGSPGVPRHDRDVRQEAVGPAIRGEIPLFIHASALDQIRAALDFAEEHALERVVLVGARDAWRVAEELKRRDVAVIAGPILALPRTSEPYDTAFTLPAKLHAAGVRFCISDGGNASQVRNLPHHAAKAAAFGLPRDEALKAITLYPARILGVDDELGSIEAGKRADLVIADGDALELTTHVEQVYISGRAIPMESRHTRLFEKWNARPRR